MRSKRIASAVGLDARYYQITNHPTTMSFWRIGWFIIVMRLAACRNPRRIQYWRTLVDLNHRPTVQETVALSDELSVRIDMVAAV